ncbi:MAG: GNAT family N-acetyltransferase, partial [Bacillota bacterium]|nr:GNAT family N-acetyltransferase [Bacillota bacterium]
MESLLFKEVTNENLKAVWQLSDALSDAQKKCVASNVKSLAQAYVNLNDAWPRAVYHGEEPIGFIMLHLHPDDHIPEADRPAMYLWRLMIAGPHQGKGYGKTVLDMLVEKGRVEG